MAVGSALGPARRVIDAEGLVVTPGWVDIHTHYDGQVTWDPVVAPSSVNGVTSIAMGNCGVGFAPARPDRHEWLIGLLEGVEDIPGTALSEGLPWDWESFPEYLDAVDRLPHTVDIGSHVPHAALRTYVMVIGAPITPWSRPPTRSARCVDSSPRHSTPVRWASPRRARTSTARVPASSSAR